MTQAWEGSAYTGRLQTAASLISAHTYRGTDRDVIYVNLGDWDHHAVSVRLLLPFYCTVAVVHPLIVVFL